MNIKILLRIKLKQNVSNEKFNVKYEIKVFFTN